MNGDILWPNYPWCTHHLTRVYETDEEEALSNRINDMMQTVLQSDNIEMPVRQWNSC